MEKAASLSFFDNYLKIESELLYKEQNRSSSRQHPYSPRYPAHSPPPPPLPTGIHHFRKLYGGKRGWIPISRLALGNKLNIYLRTFQAESKSQADRVLKMERNVLQGFKGVKGAMQLISMGTTETYSFVSFIPYHYIPTPIATGYQTCSKKVGPMKQVIWGSCGSYKRRLPMV